VQFDSKVGNAFQTVEGKIAVIVRALQELGMPLDRLRAISEEMTRETQAQQENAGRGGDNYERNQAAPSAERSVPTASEGGHGISGEKGTELFEEDKKCSS